MACCTAEHHSAVDLHSLICVRACVYMGMGICVHVCVCELMGVCLCLKSRLCQGIVQQTQLWITAHYCCLLLSVSCEVFGIKPNNVLNKMLSECKAVTTQPL
jgi:hypothetical protein